MRATYDVVMLVMNGIESDSRVLRTARTAQGCGLTVLLIGLANRRATDDEAAIRLPIPDLEAYLVPVPKLPPADVGTREQGERHRTLLRAYEEAVLSIAGTMSPKIVHSHDMTTIAAGGRLTRHLAEAGRSPRWIHDLHEWVGGLTTIAEPIREVSAEDEQAWVRVPDVLTTVSPAIARILSAEYGLPAEPIVLLNAPPLADYEAEFEPSLRTAIGLLPDIPLAVYCGQVKEARGVHDLISALPYLPELHVALVSNNRGAYIDRLVALAEESGSSDRLHLLPYVDQRRVASFIRTADLGVHPLARYGNGDVALPNKLFEYIHASLPMVVSDCRAMADFVERHGIGASYPAGNPAALADRLRAVLARRHELAERVEAIRGTYSWEQQENRLRAIYAHLLGVGSIAERPPFGWHRTASETPPSNNALRVLHGPAGSANQPWTLASALRSRGHSAHNLVTAVPRLGFRASLLVPWQRMSNAERFDLIRSLAADFDVFHFHARSFFLERGTFRFPTFIDLLLLRLLGKVVIFHFRGSEARLASEFARRSPYNYVKADPYGFSGSYPEERQRSMIAFVRSIANAVYVTDPELQGYVPGSEIVPRAIDLGDWQPVGASGAARPLVVHAPTRPELKGTQHVIDAVNQLRGEGMEFDFELIENMPHGLARQLYERADVIVDQLLIGWYGVLAVEGMALAKPVIAYVRPDLIEHLGAQHPLAVADPSNITDVLRGLLQNQDLRQRIGFAGRDYVERVHSSDVVARILEERYRALLAAADTRGADYDGIATFLEMQAQHLTDTWMSLTGTRRQLRTAEKVLNQATVAPTANGVAAARDRLVTARGDLDHILGHAGAGTSSAPVPQPEAGPQPPPSVKDVVERDAWGSAVLIRRLADPSNSTWEDVAAGVATNRPEGLELLDHILNAQHDGPRDAVIRALAPPLAAALLRDGDGSPVPAEAMNQVRFARFFYNLRSVIGPDADRASSGLLRSVLAGDEGIDSANPLRGAPDDESRTRLNHLCWFFINTAPLKEVLDEATLEAYARSVAWFANQVAYWEAPAFRTTRLSLGASLPIRISFPGQASAEIVATPAGNNATLEVVRLNQRSSGRVESMELILSTRVDAETHVDLHVPEEETLIATIAFPEYAFDPAKSSPRFRRWQVADELRLDGAMARSRFAVPRQYLMHTGGLTPFEVRAGRYVSPTLNRQIQQMETLARLHGRDEFAGRARAWREFADYWAKRPG